MLMNVSAGFLYGKRGRFTGTEDIEKQSGLPLHLGFAAV